jgi:predicted RNase H-like HicB family nuclease
MTTRYMHSMPSHQKSLTTILEPCEEGGYTIYLAEIPEVISEGETAQEAVANLADAFRLFLEMRLDEADDQSDNQRRLELSLG